ncbi:MAG: hypothetical protein HY774_11880 [Acidobacteria bacterium]|nr:hypothetical protein [Acidobacteriota bacterium]
MSIKHLTSRSFEHVLRNPSHEKGLIKSGEDPRRYFFERLARVVVHHSFYNGEDDVCPDFRILPTPSTALLMQSLGLVFKEERGGFSVFYNTKQTDGLIAYLERQKTGHPPGIWERLSFVFVSTNQFFVNFTQIKISINPALENFYFTNQKVHLQGQQRFILHPETYVTERETLEVTPIQVAVPVSQAVKKVKVRAISGETVLCFPRCFPEKLLLQKTPNAITCKDAETARGKEVCRDVIYIDFSAVPEDKYTIELIGKDREIIDRQEVLYTIAAPVPLCFINLLFTSPDGRNPDHYPVQPLPTGTIGIIPITYEIHFTARSTVWNYYVVPQRLKERFSHLHIKDLTPDQVPIKFAGPCRVKLANGATAYRFVSKVPIQLAQIPTRSFQLWGKHGLMVQEGVLIDRLPVASMQQVLPETRAGICLKLLTSLDSDAAETVPCQNLIKHLCHFQCDTITSETCSEQTKHLRAMVEAEKQEQLKTLIPKIQNCSDIFVYL